MAFAPVLAYPNFEKPFVLLTDASYGQLSAILAQVDEHGMERPISYASRCLTPTEQRYGITDKEALGVVFGTRKFRPMAKDSVEAK